MKKIMIGVVVAGLLISSGGSVRAQMMGGEMMGEVNEQHMDDHETLDVALKAVLDKYQIKEISDLSCDKLTDDDFERIGDGLMESNHPGEAHENMDAMMGGEGSEALRQMHINMGRGYLGCWDGAGYDGTMMGSNWGNGIMGGVGMMNGWNTGNGWAMMNNWSLNNLIWSGLGLAGIVLVLVMVRYFWFKGNQVRGKK